MGEAARARDETDLEAGLPALLACGTDAQPKPDASRDDDDGLCFICCDDVPSRRHDLRVGTTCGCSTLAVHVYPCLQTLVNHGQRAELPTRERLTCSVCLEQYRLPYSLRPQPCEPSTRVVRVVMAEDTVARPQLVAVHGTGRSMGKRKCLTLACVLLLSMTVALSITTSSVSYQVTIATLVLVMILFTGCWLPRWLASSPRFRASSRFSAAVSAPPAGPRAVARPPSHASVGVVSEQSASSRVPRRPPLVHFELQPPPSPTKRPPRRRGPSGARAESDHALLAAAAAAARSQRAERRADRFDRLAAGLDVSTELDSASAASLRAGGDASRQRMDEEAPDGRGRPLAPAPRRSPARAESYGQLPSLAAAVQSASDARGRYDELGAHGFAGGGGGSGRRSRSVPRAWLAGSFDSRIGSSNVTASASAAERSASSRRGGRYAGT